MKKMLAIFAASSVLLFLNTVCSAQYRTEVVPSITIGERVDDNIFLTESNEVSDYLTTISPAIGVSLIREYTNLALRYAPTFVRYRDREDLDYTRHLGNVAFDQKLSDRLEFNLQDTYLKSEDPLADPADPQGLRTTRSGYWRNTGETSLGFLFGPQNKLSLGYGQSNLENEDPTIADGRVYRPFGNLGYWFNVRNGIELSYTYIDAAFRRDDFVPAGDDFTGQGAGLKYLHRFSQQTTGYGSYYFTQRDFLVTTQDYDVHEASLGLEHAFSPSYSVSLGGGAFVQDNEVSKNETGVLFDAALIREFHRGTFKVGGKGGWDQAYLQPEKRNFTRFWSAFMRVDYQLLEAVSIYAYGSYRADEDNTKRGSKVIRGDGGVRWSFLRWFSLSLEYGYADREDDIPTQDYRVNRVALILSASKLYK